MSWPLTLTYIFKVILPCFDLGDPTWLNSVGNHWGGRGYPQNASVLVVLVFSCDQAALRTLSFRPSVCLSVRPSVTPFSQCSCNRIIMNFSRLITNDRSDVHAKGQDQTSRVKVTEVKTQFSRFRAVTPVWIHIWWWNVAQNLMLVRRGVLLFFKVIRQISRSHV